MHHLGPRIPFTRRNLPSHGAAQPHVAVYVKSLIAVALWRPPLRISDLSDLICPPLQPPAKYLLPEMIISDYGKKCVVIDLDETLVHSSFKVKGEEKRRFTHLNSQILCV